jgi:hypothetical protein
MVRTKFVAPRFPLPILHISTPRNAPPRVQIISIRSGIPQMRKKYYIQVHPTIEPVVSWGAIAITK